VGVLLAPGVCQGRHRGHIGLRGDAYLRIHPPSVARRISKSPRNFCYVAGPAGSPDYEPSEAQLDEERSEHRPAVPSAGRPRGPGRQNQAGPANYYAQFWHENAINGKQYGFPYDDDASQSSDISVANPQWMIVAVGW
jgi:hypothetical protein